MTPAVRTRPAVDATDTPEHLHQWERRHRPTPADHVVTAVGDGWGGGG